MGDSEPPDILYETCACVIHLQLHVHTPRSIFLSLFNSLKTLSPNGNHQLLGTRGPRNRSHDVSVYETCACVIHTNLLGYTCAFNSIVIFNLRGVHVLREALVVTATTVTEAAGTLG